MDYLHAGVRTWSVSQEANRKSHLDKGMPYLPYYYYERALKRRLVAGIILFGASEHLRQPSRRGATVYEGTVPVSVCLPEQVVILHVQHQT